MLQLDSETDVVTAVTKTKACHCSETHEPCRRNLRESDATSLILPCDLRRFCWNCILPGDKILLNRWPFHKGSRRLGSFWKGGKLVVVRL